MSRSRTLRDEEKEWQCLFRQKPQQKNNKRRYTLNSILIIGYVAIAFVTELIWDLTNISWLYWLSRTICGIQALSLGIIFVLIPTQFKKWFANKVGYNISNTIWFLLTGLLLVVFGGQSLYYMITWLSKGCFNPIQMCP
jgi:hypothetical protein